MRGLCLRNWWRNWMIFFELHFFVMNSFDNRCCCGTRENRIRANRLSNSESYLINLRKRLGDRRVVGKDERQYLEWFNRIKNRIKESCSALEQFRLSEKEKSEMKGTDIPRIRKGAQGTWQVRLVTTCFST